MPVGSRQQNHAAQEQESARCYKDGRESEMSGDKSAQHRADHVAQETEARVVSQDFPLHGQRRFLPYVGNADRHNSADSHPQQKADEDELPSTGDESSRQIYDCRSDDKKNEDFYISVPVGNFSPLSRHHQIAESGRGKRETGDEGEIFRAVNFVHIQRQNRLDAEMGNLDERGQKQNIQKHRVLEQMSDHFFAGVRRFFPFFVLYPVFFRGQNECGREENGHGRQLKGRGKADKISENPAEHRSEQVAGNASRL